MTKQAHTPNSMTVHAAGVAVVVVAAGCLWILGLGPRAQRLETEKSQRLQIAAASERLAALKASQTQQTTDLDGLLDELASSQVQLQSLRARNEKLRQLTELASEFGLEIDVQPFATPVQRDLYMAQPIELRGRGGFQASAKFLSEVLVRFSDVQVSSFSLTSGAGGGQQDKFRFDLAWYADRDGSGAQPSGQSG